MKINFNQKFKNFTGEVLKDANSDKELSLKDVAIEALLAVEKDSSLDGMEKAKRYYLSVEIYQDKKEGLSSEEVVLLKQLIGKFFTPIIVGQAFMMLEGE